MPMTCVRAATHLESGMLAAGAAMAEERKSPKDAAAEARRRRLAAELRANLAKRKAQARARAGADGTGVASAHRSAERPDRT